MWCKITTAKPPHQMHKALTMVNYSVSDRAQPLTACLIKLIPHVRTAQVQEHQWIADTIVILGPQPNVDWWVQNHWNTNWLQTTQLRPHRWIHIPDACGKAGVTTHKKAPTSEWAPYHPEASPVQRLLQRTWEYCQCIWWLLRWSCPLKLERVRWSMSLECTWSCINPSSGDTPIEKALSLNHLVIWAHEQTNQPYDDWIPC